MTQHLLRNICVNKEIYVTLQTTKIICCYALYKTAAIAQGRVDSKQK